MANENKDVLRVTELDASLDATIRERQLGFATDTHELAFKAPGGTTYRYPAEGSDVIGGDLYTDEYVYHNGDTDTHTRFTSDRIRLVAGGITALDIVEDTTDYIQYGMSQYILSDFKTEYGTGSGAGSADAYIEYESATEDLVIQHDNAFGDIRLTHSNTGNIVLEPNGTNTCDVIIGGAASALDYRLVFNGQGGSGIIDWQFDQDYLRFQDDILMQTTERVYFRDTDISIASLDDGKLDFTADTGFDFNTGDVVMDAALTVNVTNGDSDFEVKAETSGTALICDVSEKNVAIGIPNPSEKLHISESNDGGTTTCLLQNSNTSNTASHAAYYVKTGGGSSGDPKMVLEVDSVQTWAMGIDNGDGDKFKLATGSDVGLNNILTCLTTGELGVGTPSPLSLLHVESSAPILTIASDDNSIVIDQELGYVNFYSNDTSTTSVGGVGGFGVYAEAAYDNTTTPSYMAFYTHSTSTNDGSVQGDVDEQMRIDSIGNLGLGNAALNNAGLGSTFTVATIGNSTADTYGVIELYNSNATSSMSLGQLRFQNLDGGSSVVAGAMVNGYRDGADDASAIGFWTEAAGDSQTQIIKLDSTGNINMLKDGQAIIAGEDSEVSLQHVHDAGWAINSDNYMSFRDSAIYINSANNGYMDFTADTAFRFNTGRVGIACTPADWDATYEALTVEDYTSLSNSVTSGYLTNNAVYDNTDNRWEYVIDSTGATQYKMLDGLHTFSVGTGGASPGDPITWLTALQMSSSRTFIFSLGDNAGARTFVVEDSDGTDQFEINSDGEVSIKGDGTLVLENDATVWEDANVDLSPLQSGGTKPGFATPGTSGVRLLSYAVGEDVDGTIEIPHSYKLGSDITPHIHFVTIGAPSGTDNVKFEVDYWIVDAGGTVTTDSSIDTGDIAVTADDTRYDGNFGTISNAALGGQIGFKVKRIAAAGDAYAGECGILTFGFHYEIDTIGSRQITVK